MLERSRATLWTTLPERIPRFVLGSLTPTNCASAMLTAGSGQVSPRLDDRIAWMVMRGFVELFCAATISTFTSAPPGNTAIWLEMVCVSGPGS